MKYSSERGFFVVNFRPGLAGNCSVLFLENKKKTFQKNRFSLVFFTTNFFLSMLDLGELKKTSCRRTVLVKFIQWVLLKSLLVSFKIKSLRLEI